MSQPLPSWRPGAVREAVLAFVKAVTTQGGEDFVPPAERVAVFDNDGTLWCEQPVQVQVAFARDRIKELAEADPSLKTKQPWKAFLEHDLATLHAMGKEAVFKVGLEAHSGMTVQAFDALARGWLGESVHPRFRRLYTELVYRPQLELLGYLRAHGFKTFIVSGGGQDLIRAFAERIYGIPPEQVIGSSVKTKFDDSQGRIGLMKLAELDSFDDREAKVRNIGLHIGRRPILAFGNSDGDLAMMRYTLAGKGRRLALLLHHDDDDREVAYDRDFHLSPLIDALDNAEALGVTVVSMKRDWAGVFVDPLPAE